MTTPDKMFTLDPIKTAVTQPLQELKADQGSDTSVADAQFSQGLTAFGAAVGSLAERKKQEQIDADIALAQEAAVRNEVMPGGLLPVAVEAFEKTQDIQTANQAYADIEIFYEGEEVQAITNNSMLTPMQKNTQISTAIDNLFRVSASSVRDADVLLALKNKIAGLKVGSMRDVWNIDKNQRYGVSMNTVSGQIDNGFDLNDPKNPPETIFTNDWVKNVSGQLRKGLPWVSQDDARLAVFSSLATNENMLANPDIMTKIMQGEFAKGVTFSALAGSPSTSAAGEQISRIYATFLEKSDRHFEDIKKEEREEELDRNELAMEKGQEYLDSMDDSSDPDYPHRFKVLRRMMVDEQNGSIATYNKMVRINTTLEEYTKNNFESKAHTDAKILISSGSIKTQQDVIDYAHRNNLDTESRSLLISFLASDNKEYSKAIDQLKGQTNTVNGSLSSALRLKIAPNSGLLSMFDNLGPEEIKASKLKISDILGGATVNPDELVSSMIELAELRDKLRVDMDAEVRAAIQEGRPVDSVSIVSNFHKEAQEFIKRIGEPEKTEEVEKVEKVEVKKEVTREDKPEENTEEDKNLFLNFTNLPVSEQVMVDGLNVVVDYLSIPFVKLEEAGKSFGEVVASDVADVIGLPPLDPEEVANQIAETGKIPKDVEDNLTKKSWVLDKLLNFFGGEEKVSKVMKNADFSMGGVAFAGEPEPTPVDGTMELNVSPSLSSVTEDLKTLKPNLQPDVSNKAKKISTIVQNGRAEANYSDIISIVEAVKKDDTKFKDLNDGKLTATNGMTAERVNELLGTTYGLGDTLSKADYDATFKDYKGKILAKIKTFEPDKGFSNNQKLALFMLLYNTGQNIENIAPLGIAALKAGNFTEAAHELFSKEAGITSGRNNSRQKATMPGLLKRRLIERTIFETPDEHEKDN